ncbi:toll/interleukin-1 receptor domain-containing protein [uncultured Thiothrix sp.]|uniref:toll/interleukin-1 receptor domain-containing protein n=1 Tax=uncultured Thiothrix sp. TaxID=223185 RepID=UPI0026332B60|nr:toll/interleukin-1 receptor domain-containing protein [uncultured Thiothrix sp.]
MLNRTRLFISYSHDSEQHLQFVLELAERLLEDGFNCVLDFYLDEAPEEGWRTWLEAELTEADFVLVICTPHYLERYQANKLITADTEEFGGLVITEALYNAYAKQTKFVPILPEGGKLQDIIPPLQGQNVFELMTDYLGLHQLLKNRPARLAKLETQAVWTEPNTAPQLESLPQKQPVANKPNVQKNQPSEHNLFFYLLAALGILILGTVIIFLFL